MTNLLISNLISAIIQISIVSMVGVILWFITSRKLVTYRKYIGLYKFSIASRHKFWIYITILFSLLATSSIIIPNLLPNDINTVASSFASLGWNGVPAAFIHAFLVTGIPEEMLFRSIILKRLKSRFTLKTGNIIQATLFGLLHGIMFFTLVSPLTATAIIIFTGSIGYAMGYINEEHADGSIFPSIIIHGLSNFVAALVYLF